MVEPIYDRLMESQKRRVEDKPTLKSIAGKTAIGGLVTLVLGVVAPPLGIVAAGYVAWEAVHDYGAMITYQQQLEELE